MASTSASSWSSAISRLTYPYCSARGPSRSSATRRISSARPRPTRRESLAIGPPPGTTPTPTSHWPRSVFSREANRRSQASTNSLPAPRARPRIEAMLTTGARARRTDKDVDPGRQSSGTDPECLSPAGVVLQVIMGQVEIPVGAVEHNDVEVRILLDEAGEVAELGDGRRRDRVNRRVVERHMAVSGAAAIDPEVLPGPGPHFGIAGIVRRARLNRIHVELQSCIRGLDLSDIRHIFLNEPSQLGVFPGESQYPLGLYSFSYSYDSAAESGSEH